MRTLILGSKGQLGRDLMEIFAGRGAVKGCDLPQLDIANVSMGTKHERRGYFKEVWAQLLAECKRWGVQNMFLENVGNEHLAAWMDRQPGWVRAEDSNWNTPSYNYLVAQEVPA